MANNAQMAGGVHQLAYLLDGLRLTPASIRSPVVLTDSDRLAQYVSFRGKSEPLVEPHLGSVAVEKRMECLWKARWSEHVVESHVKHFGPLGDRAARLSNTPIQLYLLYNRLVRARMEVDIYSEVLSRSLPPALHDQFRIMPAEQFLRMTQRNPEAPLVN